MLDFATLWNRSKRFIDRAVDLYAGDEWWHGADGSRRVKVDDVEKASADARAVPRRAALRRFILAARETCLTAIAFELCSLALCLLGSAAGPLNLTSRFHVELY